MENIITLIVIVLLFVLLFVQDFCYKLDHQDFCRTNTRLTENLRTAESLLCEHIIQTGKDSNIFIDKEVVLVRLMDVWIGLGYRPYQLPDEAKNAASKLATDN